MKMLSRVEEGVCFVNPSRVRCAEVFWELLDITVEEPEECALNPTGSWHSDVIMLALEGKVASVLTKDLRPFPEVDMLLRRILFLSDADQMPLAIHPVFSQQRAVCERYWNRVGESFAAVKNTRSRLGQCQSQYVLARYLFPCLQAPYFCLEREGGAPFGVLKGGCVLQLFLGFCRHVIVPLPTMGPGLIRGSRRSFCDSSQLLLTLLRRNVSRPSDPLRLQVRNKVQTLAGGVCPRVSVRALALHP